MSGKILRGIDARPDRSSRQAVESAIESSKVRTGSWGNLGRQKSAHVPLWEEKPTSEQPERHGSGKKRS